MAISRAMKRLIVSGSTAPNKFTPYVRTILNRFTLRFVRDFNYDTYLFEISVNEMRVLKEGRLIRKYTDISNIYNENCRTQFDLRSRIFLELHSSDIIEGLDRMIMQVPGANIIRN